jgi:glycosyltransferase involved in cell wall biosynthesis
LRPEIKEIILVDDCTKDLEVADMRNLVPEDIVFIFHSNSQNLGAGFSRNIGVGLSSANYIIFFDDDDVSLPTRSVIHKEAFQNGASISYVSSRKHYSNGYQVAFPNLEILPGVLDPKQLAQKLLCGSTFRDSIGDVPSSTLAISKHEFIAVGGFDHSMRRLEDIDLAIRLSLSLASFSWSSTIAVDRISTFRQDKGGLVETNHEQILLQKYGYLIGWWRKNYALALITLRSLYFYQILPFPGQDIHWSMVTDTKDCHRLKQYICMPGLKRIHRFCIPIRLNIYCNCYQHWVELLQKPQN